jgi:light-regulated signal transduction histidine kinase (bacteriophytochrome)
LLVEGDPDLLATAMENLLANAWKFTSQMPKAHIEVGLTTKDGRSAYFVRDDGAGFDMDHAHKLFGAFQRLHATVEFPGTGIGLATVQRIVRRHGGRIWAEGEVGRGATFSFTLGGAP